MSVETPTQELATIKSDLPEPVQRRGISEAQWRTLTKNLFPGADPHSVLMVVDYCIARKLDPLKKPCHIVPMRVKDAKTGDWGWRDVVMPGIYEYRTTAQRTGEYLGHSRPEYGPPIDYAGIKVPEWCDITVYRYSRHSADGRIEFPVRRYFVEVVGLTKEGKPNDRWSKAPIQMLEKCTEAAALREAFPDEFGGEATAEEMDTERVLDVRVETPVQPAQRKSQQAIDVALVPVQTVTAAAGEPATVPHVGAVTDVKVQGDAAMVTLSTGFQAVTRDAEMIAALQRLRGGSTRVDLATAAAKDPAKYKPKVTEMTVLRDGEA